MKSPGRIFDKKWLIFSVIASIFSLTTIIFLSILTRRSEYTQHITFSYYIEQLLIILPTLPVSFFLFSILTFRKHLDYQRLIGKFSVRSYLFAAILFSFTVTNLISFFFYDHIPQGDAVSAFLQAKVFASGHPWVTPPKYPMFFLKSMVIGNGKWFSMVQHGHSLLLTPFMIIHLPYLLSTILSCLSIIVFFFFLRNCFDVISAKEGVLFLLLSPTFLFISSSYLNQNSSFFLILLSLLFLSLCIKHKNRLFPFLCGIFSGLAFFSRTTVVAFIPAIIVLLFISGRERRKRTILFFLIGFLPAFSIQFIDNLIYTGSLFRFGYALHCERNLHTIGFGIGKGEPTFNIPGHTPLKAIINLLYNIFAFSLHLYGWPLLSLIFIPFAFLRWKKNLWDVLAVSLIILTAIFFSFYWFHGVSPMGPKYYFEIVPLLVILSIRGIRKLNIRPLITLFFIFDIFIYIPSGLRIFKSIWGTNNNCYNEVKKNSIHNAIVFIKDLPGSNEYERTINRHNYLSVAFRNGAVIKNGDIIYAKDLGKERNILLINEFNNRKPYIFEYTNGGKTWEIRPYSEF